MVNRSIIFSFIVFSTLKSDVLPLTQRYFHNEDMGHFYARGTYMIILSDASLETYLTDENTGNFVEFKKSQGYNVVVQNFDDVGKFFDTMPKLQHVVNVKNPKTKKKGEVVLEGMQSFFE